MGGGYENPRSEPLGLEDGKPLLNAAILLLGG
jgi:hypothetical protein